MCYLLIDWKPSQSAIDLIKLNGVNDEQISTSVEYLKNQSEISNLDDLSGYDNWNSFFILFCIKAHAAPNQ